MILKPDRIHMSQQKYTIVGNGRMERILSKTHLHGRTLMVSLLWKASKQTAHV